MASAEHEPITGVWGQSPQRGPGAEPLVRGSGGQSPPEAESILVIGCPTEPAHLAPVRENSMLCYSPLVSELGRGPRVHGAPNHVIGGLCPPAPGSAAYAGQAGNYTPSRPTAHTQRRCTHRTIAIPQAARGDRDAHRSCGGRELS